MEFRLSAALALNSGGAAALIRAATGAAEESARAEVEAVAAGVAEISAVVANPMVGERFAVSSDDAPWPTDEGTAPPFHVTAPAGGETAITPAVVHRDEVANNAPLPPLDTLVARIPVEVREALEELFRAKFTGVRRVPAKHLNP